MQVLKTARAEGINVSINIFKHKTIAKFAANAREISPYEQDMAQTEVLKIVSGHKGDGVKEMGQKGQVKCVRVVTNCSGDAELPKSDGHKWLFILFLKDSDGRSNWQAKTLKERLSGM